MRRLWGLMMRDIQQHFFTRAGGVSEGLYASLNVGIGSADNAAHVLENRARVAAHFGLPPENLATVQQIHSAKVVRVESYSDCHAGFMPASATNILKAQTPSCDGVTRWSVGDTNIRPKADAMVTNQPNILLGILTADCAPVLFADETAGVIGAAHAGWKGAHLGVLENVVATMESLGALRQNITAHIGPCIAQASYEVGAEFRDRLLAEDEENDSQFTIHDSRPNKFLFNLPAYVQHKLAFAGVMRITASDADTCSDEKNYFSYRRATLRGQPDYGRQISCIVMR